MAQFPVADIAGALNRGIQFKQQQDLNPLQIDAAKLAVQKQQQGLQFGETQNRALNQQIDARTNDQKNKSLFNTALSVRYASDEEIIPLLQANIERVTSLSGNPQESVKALQLAEQGDFSTVRAGAENIIKIGVGQKIGVDPDIDNQMSAEQASFESLISDFSNEDKKKARRIKAGLDPRMVGSANQTIANLGTEKTVANVGKVISDAKETGKLTAQYKLKPAVEAAVISSVGNAKIELTKMGEDKSNSKTLEVYNAAMGNLTKALDETITGPFIGLTPAMTSNAQIADGAVAMMLPLMKDVFRKSGEGTFTEGDQKILTDLIPTRNDTPEARASKISMIDSMIRAKLSSNEKSEESLSKMSDEELFK